MWRFVFLNVMCSVKYKKGNNKNAITNTGHRTLIWKWKYEEEDKNTVKIKQLKIND
jgi:hypothetical protein